jgi:hypothetical protein
MMPSANELSGLMFSRRFGESALPTQHLTAAVAQHGAQGCVEILAGEYGERPELAVARMRFARELATTLALTRAMAGS